MSRRFSRLSLVLVLLLGGKGWAVGLGDIQLDSALNEPLRAEISLLGATPDELTSLKIALASPDTFSRYGIDRPVYLQQIRFVVIANGAQGPVVKLTSPVQMTEPFLTFLVEASWPGGRLLREYTVLLDPPTYVPPAVQQAPAVTAPSVSAPADTGRIERPAVTESTDMATATPPVARPQPRPQPQPAPPRRQQPTAPVDTSPYDTRSAGAYVVQRGETLWGIASRMRPDNRMSMNQTMLAIYEANPGAFDGNINRLKAGATMRIPSADEVFQISRGDAFSEVKRQNTNWQGGVTDAARPRAETRPSLTLVPPDEEPAGVAYDDESETTAALTREQEVENRIADLEAADVPQQQSLIEIRDNELANLRQELANIRGEVYEPPVADTIEDPFVDDRRSSAGRYRRRGWQRRCRYVTRAMGTADDTLADDAVADDTTQRHRPWCARRVSASPVLSNALRGRSPDSGAPSLPLSCYWPACSSGWRDARAARLAMPGPGSRSTEMMQILPLTMNLPRPRPSRRRCAPTMPSRLSRAIAACSRCPKPRPRCR